MRSAEEMRLLMSFTPQERNFVVDAEKYIEKLLEEQIYNYAELYRNNVITVDMEDLLDAVFTFEKDGGRKIITSWRTPTKRRSIFQDIPEELHNKSWQQIYMIMKSDPYKEWDFIIYLNKLKLFLEYKGYGVSDIYPFYSEKITISF